MYAKIKQNTESEEDLQEVLVPVRRSEAEKEIEQEIQEEPQIEKRWETPQRWHIY